MSQRVMKIMTGTLAVITLATSLMQTLPIVSAYSPADVASVEVTVTSTGLDAIQFGLDYLSGGYEGAVDGLPAGPASVHIKALNSANTIIYSGNWNGNVRNDGQITQVNVYLLDQEVYNNVEGKMPPFITSMIIDPSNVGYNEIIEIKINAEDLNTGESTSLTYNIDGLNSNRLLLDGPCMGISCIARYTVADGDALGLNTFTITVSDEVGELTSLSGGFNLRPVGGNNINVIFNTHPTIYQLEISDAYLYPGSSVATVSATIQDNDAQDTVSYSWEIEQISGLGNCNLTDFTGDLYGSFVSLYTSELVYHPVNPQIARHCRLTLTAVDSRGAEVEGYLYVKTGLEPIKTPPFLIFSTQSGNYASNNQNIRLFVMAEDSEGSNLHFTWSHTNCGSLSSVQETKENTANAVPFRAFTTTTVSSNGDACVITCTVTDGSGLSFQKIFSLSKKSRRELRQLEGAKVKSNALSMGLSVYLQNGKLSVKSEPIFREILNTTGATILTDNTTDPDLEFPYLEISLIILCGIFIIFMCYKLSNTRKVQNTNKAIVSLFPIKPDIVTKTETKSIV